MVLHQTQTHANSHSISKRENECELFSVQVTPEDSDISPGEVAYITPYYTDNFVDNDFLLGSLKQYVSGVDSYSINNVTQGSCLFQIISPKIDVGCFYYSNFTHHIAGYESFTFACNTGYSCRCEGECLENAIFADSGGNAIDCPAPSLNPSPSQTSSIVSQLSLSSHDAMSLNSSETSTSKDVVHIHNDSSDKVGINEISVFASLLFAAVVTFIGIISILLCVFIYCKRSSGMSRYKLDDQHDSAHNADNQNDGMRSQIAFEV